LLLRVLQRLIRHLFLQETRSTSTSWHRKYFLFEFFNCTSLALFLLCYT
jgi:hypothetical protein